MYLYTHTYMYIYIRVCTSAALIQLPCSGLFVRSVTYEAPLRSAWRHWAHRVAAHLRGGVPAPVQAGCRRGAGQSNGIVYEPQPISWIVGPYSGWTYLGPGKSPSKMHVLVGLPERLSVTHLQNLAATADVIWRYVMSCHVWCGGVSRETDCI